jgi:hypothetical protein
LSVPEAALSAAPKRQQLYDSAVDLAIAGGHPGLAML